MAIEPAAGSSTASSVSGAVDCGLDRGVGTLEPARKLRQPCGIKTFVRECLHQTAQPHTGETRITIGGVIGITKFSLHAA